MSFGRITNLMVSQTILSEVNSAQGVLDTTEEQLSSGKTINQPSDNPYGASLAIQLNGQLNDINGYNSNITDAQAWTSTASTALTTIQDDIQRAQELVTEAGNGTVSTQDQAQIGDEINQLIGSIKSAADTQYNGQYIFSGTATDTEPYQADQSASDTYAGGTGNITRSIGPSATTTVNVDLSSVLGNGLTGSPATSDGGVLGTLRTIADQLTSGTGTSELNTTDLTNLQSNLNSLESLQTQVGVTSDQLTMASSSMSALQTSITSQLSNDQDVNMATAMTSYSNEQAAFTAALKAGASIDQSSLMDFLTES